VSTDRPEALGRIEALAQVALRIANTARSGRVALAQLHGALDPQWLAGPRGRRLLETLEDAGQAALEPLSSTQVEDVLRRAWGVAPGEELDELDPEPLAVTPTAQVHRARLDGAPVAVKIVRPGLAASVRQDVILLETLAAPLAAAFPALQAPSILAEVRERVLEQFDLEHEAMLQRRFHRALRGHPELFVPAPVMRLCHEPVLVSELVDGVALWRAPDPDRAAAQLVRFVFGAAQWGVAYGDPDGENALVTEDGRLTIVDFGFCREVDRDRLACATAALAAVIDNDADALVDALQTLVWLPPEQAPAALELVHAVLGEHLRGRPSRLDAGAALAAGERLRIHAPQVAGLLPAAALDPVDLWPARGFVQLFGTIARLGARGDWAALALEALRNGWG
jgi:predicted unusual protein kinase regulating ubiquinone biosynthesis (AarF/ABC1/UbiB family)